MVFIKGMLATKGFTGKKHTRTSKRQMSIGQSLAHKRRNECACTIAGERRPDFTFHSQYDCHNQEVGVLKA